jgi:hypothetical protein
MFHSRKFACSLAFKALGCLYSLGPKNLAIRINKIGWLDWSRDKEENVG